MRLDFGGRGYALHLGQGACGGGLLRHILFQYVVSIRHAPIANAVASRARKKQVDLRLPTATEGAHTLIVSILSHVFEVVLGVFLF
jgi:hypothetical protein